LRIGREIARALDAAHSAGLIHRDVKPANIWLEGPEARVKILDFGLARAASQESGVTQQGAIIGTPAYMAPEQSRGETVDARCDLFSLGVVLYRLSTGQLPFAGKDTVSTLIAVASHEPPAPATINADVPGEVSALVMKLLTKDVDKRMATAGAVVEAIKGIEKELARKADSRERTMVMAAPVPNPASIDEVLFAVDDTPSVVKAAKGASGVKLPPLMEKLPGKRSLVLIGIAAGVAAFFCLGVIGLGTILFWPTSQGIVRIEIDDPDIKVSFDDKSLTLKVGDKHDIKVKPGLHGLFVERDGLAFHTEKFELKKGQTVALKVQWLKDGKLQVVQAGRVIGSDSTKAKAAKGIPFFNGKDLTGWEGLTEYWSVKDNTLVGSAPAGVGFNTFLCSKKKFRDFELQFQVKLNKEGNSGVQIRSVIHDAKKFAVTGLQADMGGAFWGSLYGENFGGMLAAADADGVKGVLKVEQFNDFYVRCVGKRVIIKLNGLVTVDGEFPKMADEGIIAWQIHAGPPMEVTFRNIQFREISGGAAPEVSTPPDVPLAKPEDKVDVVSIPPPPGALVLFDGKSLDAWTKANGKGPATWIILPGGFMQVAGGDIMTKQSFDGKFKLHVEFRVPNLPNAKGQARGNSGVFLQGRHEIQILDSYGLPPSKSDCGAVYNVAAPRVNVCKAPMVWQSYDIVYQSAVCKDGKKVSPAIVTIHHNGILIHDKVKITTDSTIGGTKSDPCESGPIILQDHGNPVQFRNIWLVKDPDATASPPGELLPIFNGKDLSGWKVMGTNGWSVKDGILTGESKDVSGWLMSDKDYADFELTFDYKQSAGSNSGVFLRAWPEGNLGGGQFMEFQLVDDALSKDPKFQTGAIFGVIAPDPRPKATLEQWHRVAIRLDKRHLRVVFDDQQIMFTNLDDHKERFGPFLGLTKTTGRIGLQLYPGRIEFREIRVRELK
jgi:hypothetical protein